MTGLGAVASALVAAALLRLGAGPALRRLPEPADAGDKIAWAALPTPRFLAVCAVTGGLAQLVAVWSLPPRVLPLWTVLAVIGVLLAAVDARTTWLPRRLTYAGWSWMAAAVGVAVLLGATAGDTLRTAGGALAAGVLYLLVWAVTRGGFGFGDVRFAPLLGAAMAAGSWTLLLWGLTLGTAVGALHGLARLLRRRAGGFPYAPSMLAGTYLAVLALRTLVPGGP